MEDLIICVAGTAGDGSYTTASILGFAAKKLGYYVLELREIHSVIRGLHTAYFVRISEEPRYGLKDKTDLLVALDLRALKERYAEVSANGIVIFDNNGISGKDIPSEILDADLNFISLDLKSLARKEFNEGIFRNTISLGIISRILGIENAISEETSRVYKKKSLKANLKAFEIGKDLSLPDIKLDYSHRLYSRNDPGRLFILGNEAMAWGALAGGCRAIFAYPITPASEIFEWLTNHIRRFGGITIQSPSEIEAIWSTMGASFAGTRAMTATSGPGLSLMQEAISASGMNETPLVIVHVQRGGPSTGLPTRTGQEDLNMVFYQGHGDFPRIVISPATPEELFYFAAEVFNLAEKYQCPAILLSEQCMSQTKYTIDDLDFSEIKIERGKIIKNTDSDGKIKQFPRYQVTEDGISPRPLAGTEGISFLTSSNEHDEFGFACEDIESRTSQMEKRMRKLETAKKDFPGAVLHGDPEAIIGFISFGGTLGPISEAMEMMPEPSKFLRLRTLWPFSEKEVRRFVRECKIVFVVEQNLSGQLFKEIQRCVGPLPRKLKAIRRYDGRVLRPRNIVEAVKREIQK